ncbi:MAG: hypothetical protein D6B26_07990 [Spirochaetaceae bacterium]|nr:MAG: hypothetical protein D6B26_07990 [Spirochaetaceae bacterium]
MMETQLPQLNQILGENLILFCFSGPFHQELIEELGRAIKSYVKHSQSDPDVQNSTFRNVFAVFIEQSQNIKRYLDSLNDSSAERSGIVVIGKDDSGFFVDSGNRVKQEHVPALRARLEKVTGLGKDDLKQLYKETIRSHRDEDKASAGLGLIDMARKASQPLKWSFTPTSDGFEFFSLSVSL